MGFGLCNPHKYGILPAHFYVTKPGKSPLFPGESGQKTGKNL